MDQRYKQLNIRDNYNSPSFSSSLLDAIYRSIDEKDMTVKKTGSMRMSENDDVASRRRATLLEKLTMERSRANEKKAETRRKSMADFEKQTSSSCKANEKTWRKSMADFERKASSTYLVSSSSTSSDSSCGGTEGFSSSESESNKSRKSSCYYMQKPKPVRTSLSSNPQVDALKSYNQSYQQQQHYYTDCQQQKQKQENGFVWTKSKALKMYQDLKKVKQPISPGGKIAKFLNSLFTSGSTKKSKVSSSKSNFADSNAEMKAKSGYESTCSSASSLSRSCLSKNTSSSRNNVSTKRSVRFCPVNVILDEDCRPCGQKSLYEVNNQKGLIASKNSISEEMKLHRMDVNSKKGLTASKKSMREELKFRVMEENKRVEEAARDFLKKYEVDMGVRVLKNGNNHQVFADEEDEDDDAASCSSSDLFELDNLSAIGIGQRYREELPVYETTHIDTNLAIAKGLIV